MALLAPDAIRGIVVVGASMDCESMEHGCWDGSGLCTSAIDVPVAPVGAE